MDRNYSYELTENSELLLRYEEYLIGKAPGYFDVYELDKIVEFYFDNGYWEDALEVIELGEKTHPGNGQLRVMRAKYYLLMQEYDEAQSILTNIIENSDSEIAMMKLDVLLNLGREDEAWKLTEELLADSNEYHSEIYTDLAELFNDSNAFAYALRVLKVGLKHEPNNITLLFEVAMSYERQREIDKAISVYEKIVELNAYEVEAWKHLGRLYYNSFKYLQAIEAYDYVLTINEDDDFALFFKSNSLLMLDRWQEALDGFLSFEEKSDDKADVWGLIAECYEELENFSKALYYYKLLYLVAPENYSFLMGISVCLLELERFEEALQYIEEAVKLEPMQADAWVYMGEAYLELNRKAESLKAYKRAIKIEPNLPESLIAMGHICMDMDDAESALKYYKKAYKYDHTLEFIELFVAVASFYTGDFKSVVHYMELATQRNNEAMEMFIELCPAAKDM